MKEDIILQTHQLTKKYGNQIVVNKVNLNIKKGRIYGLLGRNGAGKTTLMKMMLSLISTTEGAITIFNKPLLEYKEEIYPRIGALIETPGFYLNLTGSENLKVFARLRGETSQDSVKKSLDVVGLPYQDKKSFSSYSLGMKQRLGIANAILNDPELLILDEPINGLDPIGIQEIRHFLRKLCHEEGKTIIISSHILSEISLLADDIGIIHNGVLLEESSLEDLEKKLKQYYLIKTSDIYKTIHLLERKLNINDYSIEEHDMIRVYDLKHPISVISKMIINEKIELIHLEEHTTSLEDYFKLVTGGEGIA